MLGVIKWDGKKISKPGIYSDVPIDVYHDDICDGPSVSSSGLRKIVGKGGSPAHFWSSYYLNPKAKRDDESKALLLGRAVHHLILGEKFFADAFVIQPETYVHPKEGKKPWNNNAGPCKEWKKEQKEKGLTVITISDVETIKGMARSLARDPMMQHGLLNGLMEHSGFYRDRETGIWVKIRPDAIPTHPTISGGHSADVADLKSIAGVDYVDCSRSLEDNGYYMQAALIRTGLKELLNIDVATFTFMFCEKSEPFCTRPMLLKEADMDLGDEANRVGLDVMARCLKEDNWPGPGRGPGRDIIEYVGLSDAARERIAGNLLRLKDTFQLNEDRVR